MQGVWVTEDSVIFRDCLGASHMSLDEREFPRVADGLETMGSHCFVGFTGESFYSRVSSLVQDFVHPQYYQQNIKRAVQYLGPPVPFPPVSFLGGEKPLLTEADL